MTSNRFPPDPSCIPLQLYVSKIPMLSSEEKKQLKSRILLSISKYK
ncbi:MAG: hypothetical protein J5682_00430 [Prevotella sp.]|nr:hypothetical protein [Prevotella sp.]